MWTFLVDGAPAGGMGEDQVACLSALAAAGADIRILNGNLSRKTVQHVGPLHSKYMVLDLHSVVIMSENFVESGIPNDKVFANRGWGTSITHAGLAGWLARVFDSDSRESRPDVVRWLSDRRCNLSARIPISPSSNHSVGLLEPFSPSSECKVRLVLSPDSSALAPYLNALIENSSSSLVEQFQTDLKWRERWMQDPIVNPFVSRLASCLRDGGHVRMLLDSTWFNQERNQEVVDYLGSISADESLEGEFKLMDPDSPITVVHNKGIVIDGRISVVSSNNWVWSSFASNRELAVIVDSREVADYFGRSFELDWSPDDVPPVADAGADLELQLGASVILDGSGSADDRGIMSWHWDTDGDGFADREGALVEFYPLAAGRFLVSLTVQDTWGNTGTDTMTIDVVVPESVVDEGTVDGQGHAIAWSLAGCAGVILGAFIARRLRRPPRKVNDQVLD